MPLPAFDGGGLAGTGAGAGAGAAAGAAAAWGLLDELDDEPDDELDDEPDDGATAAVARARRRCRRVEAASWRVGGGLPGEFGLSLTLEFALDGDIGQPLLLDLGELDHLGLGGGLEVLELLAGLRGGLALTLEVGALCLDVLHHGIEVVEFDRCGASSDRRLLVGGDAGVGLVEVDQQRNRRPGVHEAALRVLLQARSHRVRLRLDGRQFLLGGDDLDFEGVESRLGVEHRLCCGIGPIARCLDLLGGPNRRRILCVRDGEREGAGADSDGEHHGDGRERPSSTARRQPGHPRHERRA